MTILNKHLALYEQLDGHRIKIKGKEYKIEIKLRDAIYPYKHSYWDGCLEEINGGEYRFSDLKDFDTFLIYQEALLKN